MPTARPPLAWRATVLELVGLALAIILAAFRLFAGTLRIVSHNYRAIIALAMVYAVASCVAHMQR
jgi:hypothetical protein